MDCTSVITDIVVPFCSALLGGGLTLLGVWLTIKDQNKKEEAAKKAAARPWIFSCEEYIPQDKKTYFMVPDSDYSQDMFISGIIKNTDNGILILDCVESEAVRYTPDGDNVVDKNSAVELVKRNNQDTMIFIRLKSYNLRRNTYNIRL